VAIRVRNQGALRRLLRSMRPKALLLGVSTAALAAGCGESTTTVHSVVTQQVSTPTVTASQPGANAGKAPDEGHVGTVPKEIGARLDVAERDLQGKRLPYRVLVRGGSRVVVKSAWTVCETNPAPRTHLELGTTIRLIVARSCGQR
jgi:hypothetical protein